MASIICTNPECDQADVPKDNPMGFPSDDVVCGACGQPITETVETQGEPAS